MFCTILLWSLFGFFVLHIFWYSLLFNWNRADYTPCNQWLILRFLFRALLWFLFSIFWSEPQKLTSSRNVLWGKSVDLPALSTSVTTWNQQSKKFLPWLKLFRKRFYFRKKVNFPDSLGIFGKNGPCTVIQTVPHTIKPSYNKKFSDNHLLFHQSSDTSYNSEHTTLKRGCSSDIASSYFFRSRKVTEYVTSRVSGGEFKTK